MFHKIFKGVAPVFALALAAGVAGCNGNVSINGKDGVPLADLKMDGKLPTELVVAGPDTVTVRRGDKLTINVSGDPEAVAAMRFTLDDETLGIMRENDSWKGKGTATVAVTLPRLAKLVMAGSGKADIADLGGEAEVVIAGSGTARAAAVDAGKLEVTIAGSGTFEGAGRASTLELNVAGSGKAAMAGLMVDRAEIHIAGSGDAAFASNGTVEAKIMGSGNVTVTGSAKCTIKSMGSGTLTCTGGTTAAGDVPPAPPTPPAAPGSPTPPAAPAAPPSPQ